MSDQTLKSIGVKSVETIDYYTVRSETDNDVLKIYHKREKGALFHRSEKFKFHRASRTVRAGEQGGYSQVKEVSPMLTKVMAELDDIARKKIAEKGSKEKILADLKHLEKVVTHKLAEIEADIQRL